MLCVVLFVFMLLLLFGFLIALLYVSEQLSLEAVFSHLYTHEFFGGKYFLELL